MSIFRLLRIILLSLAIPLLYLHRLTNAPILYLNVDDTLPTISKTKRPSILTQHYEVLEDTVRLLFMENDADAIQYLEENPFHSFKFYTHQLPPGVVTVDMVSSCHEKLGAEGENLPIGEFVKQYCDWSESPCTPMRKTSSPYSKRRNNYNIDSVMARLFTEYFGPLRTSNVSHATLKIVPFPGSWWNGHCLSWFGGDQSNNLKLLQKSSEISLTDASTLFFFMNKAATLSVDFLATSRPGELVIPYVNANIEYQPDRLISNMNSTQLEKFYTNKVYALAAVYSVKIHGNGYARRDFTARIDEFFGNGTRKYNNGTLGDRKVYIEVIGGFKRTIPDEAGTMQRYRESIFCPCFRGDRPDVKRFFDVLLSGCIPVIMTDYSEDDTPEHFSGASNAVIYPWAKGSFGEDFPTMGIDYSKLVIEISEKECYVDCMVATLEKLLKDPEVMREKQKNIAKYARFFAYGMQKNAFQHVDAMSALLVRARHYALHEAPSK
eukprot:CAMPEP_0183731908 /NCGR_PEP_ID=MMETSP0737-20130205/36833_1 /TAXON_ID=385413 /ORGANISM="Thalassiosira miniscula, Strain CCMP1093" /LENGTH=492 /DNA_ID=CAMNT_0025964761 /DNA_START=201 /DNA_END=1679 /DNA_ORIENTATION=-